MYRKEETLMEKLYRLIKNGMDLSYYVATPENYDKSKKYPLIVALHGAGTYGENPEVLLGNPEYTGYLKFKPQAILLMPHSRFEPWSTQCANLKHIIDLVCESYNVDTLRISICGASMGGYGTWDMIMSYPDFFAAAAPICGGGMRWRSDCVAGMPIWVYHGDKDDVVLPERSIEIYEHLKKVNPENSELHLTICENTGHNSWEKAYLEDNIYGWLISHSRKSFSVYAAGPVAGGGISRFKLKNGILTHEETYGDEGVMYMTIKNGKLFALANEPLGKREGGVFKYDIHQSRLVNRSAIFPTFGKATCHLAVDDDENIYIANYLTGNIAKVNMQSGTTLCAYHRGESIYKPRQDKQHTHHIAITPDKRAFTVCDLGTDTIHVYDFNLCEISRVSADLASGPRHIVFSDCGRYAYCVNELNNTVTSYEYSDCTLTKIQSFDMLPLDLNGETTAAAIRICGKYLYASTRGFDSITRFEVNGGNLTYTDTTPAYGKSPRDFNISPDGKSLICANEGGNITLFNIMSDGSLEYTGTEYEVPGAMCVVFN